MAGAAALGLSSPVWALAAACGGLALALGSVPFGLVIARRFAGKDPQLLGSGNIGAANVTRVAGARLGALTLVLDAVKGAIPVGLAQHLAADAGLGAQGETLALAVGACAVAAHCFSPWLRFRGGKGVATYAGVVLTASPLVALCGVAAFAAAFALTRRASVASLAGVGVAAAAFAARASTPWTLLPVVVASSIIVVRHRDNLVRLLRRTEPALQVRPADALRDPPVEQETKAP